MTRRSARRTEPRDPADRDPSLDEEARPTAPVTALVPRPLDAPHVGLLSNDPRPFERARARRALAFVWSTGVGLEAVDQATWPTPAPAAEGFTPQAFASDLFVEELAKRCLPIVIAGERHVPDVARLVAVLEHPPASSATVDHRRETLAALRTSRACRSQAEQLYVALGTLRGSLAGSGSGRDRASDRMRRLDVAIALRDAVLALRGPWPGGGAGLASLAALGREIEAEPTFARLTELLDWEAGASEVEITVRLAADGSIRNLEPHTLRVRPPPAEVGRLAGWWRRIVQLFVGRRLDREDVVSRLLDELVTPLFDHVLTLLDVHRELEPYLGSLGLADMAQRHNLHVDLPQIRPTAAALAPRFVGLFNPFLLAEAADGRIPPPTPCDLEATSPAPLIVVTGPNSGGKTRMIQALALAVLLGQGGWFVPAEQASWPWVPALFASLAHVYEPDAPEGRLGTELCRVRALFERARPHSLVVLDELCAGTNPSEAEELVRFVMEQLAALGAFVVVTTHLLDVARRLESDPPAPGLCFRQVELDAASLPTYHFVPGVAPTSLARRTAERLGVTREALAALVARRLASPAASGPEGPSEA